MTNHISEEMMNTAALDQLSGGDPELAALVQQALQGASTETQYSQMAAAIIPSYGLSQSQTADALRYGVQAPGGAPAYTDPATGGIRLPNGVIVDPNAGPTNGVFYAPNSTAAGSYQWMKDAANWGTAKAETWRKKLNKLGYGVASKGGFDTQLAGALDTYFRYKYFFQKEMPLDDSQSGVAQQANAVYDPLVMKQDFRSALAEAIGDDPTDAEVETIYRRVRPKFVAALRRGASPEHAVAVAQEEASDAIIGTSSVQEAQTRAEVQGAPNTKLMDSFVSLGQLLS